MRPETAIRLVNKVMKKFYSSNSQFKDISEFKSPRVYLALKELSELYKRQEGFVEEYYPEAVTEEDILHQMQYISDRWQCAGRIKFVLRVIKDYSGELK